MQLNLSTATSLVLSSVSEYSIALQSGITAALRKSKYQTLYDPRVIIFDWTAAYLETTAVVSVNSSGVATLTNTAVVPKITVPTDNSQVAPSVAMIPKALEVFLISQPAVTGELRNGEVIATLTTSGAVVAASAKLVVAGADQVNHFHWSADNPNTLTTLAFSGIKQHGVRIVAVLVGAAP